MPKLYEIPRTATFAWSPSAAEPALVTGTAPGAIDADFSARTALELWRLDLLSPSATVPEPVAVAETDAPVTDIVWHPTRDIIIAGLESGVVQSWNAKTLEAGTTGTASGAIKSAAVSKVTGRLATGACGGQVAVWDVADLAARVAEVNAGDGDDVAAVAWNNSAASILAAAGSRGAATLWDTRRQTRVMTISTALEKGRPLAVSAVQWHPTDPGHLLTVSADDREPVVLVWDVRQANRPKRILRAAGSSGGILTADWCSWDPSLLLTGGSDNSASLWNPLVDADATLACYPLAENWVFKARFHPAAPSIFAASSFDGRVSVHALQGTHAEDRTTTPAQAPTWLERPASARFGLGGRIAVATNPKTGGSAATPKVVVTRVRDDVLGGADWTAYSEAVQSGDWEKLAEGKKGDDWVVLREILDGKPLVEIDKTPLEAEELPEVSAVDASIGGTLDASDYATRAVLAGDYTSAVARLLTKGKAGDALLVALTAPSPDPKLVEAARRAFAAEHGGSPAVRATALLAAGNAAQLAKLVELDEWPAVLEALGNDSTQRKAAAKVLGKRLVAANRRGDAVRAFLAGGALGAATSLWLSELPQLQREAEGAAGKESTAYAAHIRAMQAVVEKVTVALKASPVAAAGPVDDPDNDAMYGVLRDFATAASQGDLSLAKVYLDMLPDQYAQDKDRINKATAPVAPASPAKPSRRSAATSASRSSATRNAAATTGVTPSLPSATLSSTRQPAARQQTRYGPALSSSNPYVATTTTAAPVPTVPTPDKSIGSPYAPSASSLPIEPVPPTAVPPVRTSSGWNDLPDIATQRRTPVAPQIIGPPPSAVSLSKPTAKTMVPPPKVGEKPPTSVASVSRSAPGVVTPGVITPAVPLVPTPQSPVQSTPGPYTPQSVVNGVQPGPASRAPSRAPSRAKPNPYAPPPGASAPPMGNPLSGPPSGPSGFAAPPAGGIPPPSRARSAAVPPPPPPPPPAATVQHHQPSGPPLSTAAVSSVASPPPIATPPPAATSKYPRGDRSHIEAADRVIFEELQREVERVRPVVDARYHRQYVDTQRRLNILFDHLNNADLLAEDTLEDMRLLAGTVAQRDWDAAMEIATRILTERSEQAGEWMTGVRRLIQMGSAVPDSA